MQERRNDTDMTASQLPSFKGVKITGPSTGERIYLPGSHQGSKDVLLFTKPGMKKNSKSSQTLEKGEFGVS